MTSTYKLNVVYGSGYRTVPALGLAYNRVFESDVCDWGSCGGLIE